MKNKNLMTLLTAAVFLCLLCSCAVEQKVKSDVPDRIISLAPSITETLFALGLGDKVVGVTSYCHYPPRVDSIEKIGGYSDANLEKILSLKPDLAIMQEEHENHRVFLNRYGIKVLTVHYETVAEICSSFIAIGKTCGAKIKADSIIGKFDSLLSACAPEEESPKMLLSVGRDRLGSGSVFSTFIAGAGTFYNGLIEAAGGKNVFTDPVPQYPKISMEGIITLAPDIIIDIASAMGKYQCSTLVSDWYALDMIPAVKSKQVYCLSADYATIPGPRIINLLNDFRDILIKWGNTHANP